MADDGSAGALSTVAALDELSALVWALEGPEHTVVAVNRAAARATPVLGLPLAAAWPGPSETVLDACDEAVRTGRPVTAYQPGLVLTAAPWREAGCLLQAIELTPPMTEAICRDQGHDALPASLPLVPGYDLGVRYVAASEGWRAGGDWYEAVVLPDGGLAVAVGDLVGGQASVTALLRGALMSALRAGEDVPTVLGRLDDIAAQVPGAAGGTVAVAVLDPDRRELCFGSAGHPLPIVLAADGTATSLDCPRGVPLATTGDRPVRTVPLPVGAVLVLYTDGLLDGRSDATLRTAVTTGRRLTCPELCERLVTELLPAGRPVDDDAVVLVVRAMPVRMRPLRLDVAATPDQLAVVRRALHEWLTGLRVDQEDAVGVQLAVGEAVANVVEHAYRGREPGRVLINADLLPEGRLGFEVRDHGGWRDADLVESAHRGRGLQFIRASMDDVRLDRTPEGTSVRMTLRPSLGVDGEPVVAPSRSDTDSVEVEVSAETTPVRVRLAGQLDAANAEPVRNELQRASRAGTVPIRLDLDELDHLDSAGVRVLFELAMAARDSGERLSVRVPERGMVRRVLRTAGFEQLAEFVSPD
ncbi:SpoIIE family protein phosphatase [Amycolatopsis anabasis]|uniref:SpoIIE family protein phosphatase n=1 Tax=Amycolatopsis anabasis TaxID=1840409 RepID=UPI00131B6B10|nr:SpoIIE family protein phosphatase [Amycolatopsis anabasis]